MKFIVVVTYDTTIEVAYGPYDDQEEARIAANWVEGWADVAACVLPFHPPEHLTLGHP